MASKHTKYLIVKTIIKQLYKARRIINEWQSNKENKSLLNYDKFLSNIDLK